METKLFFLLSKVSSELTLSGKRWYTWSTSGAHKETIVELSIQEIEEMDDKKAQEIINYIEDMYPHLAE